ncbi:unnamed protein product [Pleuronectes platessa]|uniref:Uncharacterized protein n=1 Tax=Pleuronectes platessa TaxID=8262 RepID=A0A9N7YRL5_PLEPL|nr:unnamed protein product [Pleuronectes platessa]
MLDVVEVRALHRPITFPHTKLVKSISSSRSRLCALGYCRSETGDAFVPNFASFSCMCFVASSFAVSLQDLTKELQHVILLDATEHGC